MPPNATRTVMAARLHEPGEPLVVEEVTLPAAGPLEVYVDLAYGGVNPIDMYNAAGQVATDGLRPRTLGGEASGHLGDRPVLVAGEGLGSTRDGVWATGVVVPQSAVVPIPEGVRLQAAAAMGVAGLTAWNVVHQVTSLRVDDRALVLGAAGGVGSMIVSLARAAGATVWGQTGTPEKADFVRHQGAERVVVCGAEGLSEAIADLQPTAVFDPLGGPFLDPAVQALAPRGCIASFGTSAGPDVRFNLQSLYRKSCSIRGYGGLLLNAPERREGLDRALRALRDGDLRVRIDGVLPLQRVQEAFERLRGRQVRGKLVLELGSS